MDSIKEITNKLFSVNYNEDFIKTKKSEEYEKIAKDLIKNNDWDKVFLCWYDFLINECKTEDKILNYAHLFWNYGGYKYKIPNPAEFCAFFYVNISLEHHPWATALIDGITWEIFINEGIYSEDKDYFENFEPLLDSNLVSSINKWKEKGYGIN